MLRKLVMLAITSGVAAKLYKNYSKRNSSPLASGSHVNTTSSGH